MTIILEEEWVDPRLSFENYPDIPYIQLNHDIDSIWKPDIFFSNEKKAYTHDVTVPNRQARILRNGTVLYSVK